MKKTGLLTEKIEESIRKLIREGYYQPGDKLPNEMALSEDLSISRATLREALKALDSQNVIEIRRGIGTFISQTPGIGKDPLGFDFLNLKAHMSDILRLEDFLGQSLIDHLKCESKETCDALVNQLQDLPLRAVLAWIHDALKAMAKILDNDYLLRLLMGQNEAINQIQSSLELEKEDKEQYTYYINLWVTQLSQGDFEAAKDTFKILIQLIEG